MHIQEGEVIIDQNIQVISNNDANGGRRLRVDYAVDGNIAARLKNNNNLLLTIEISLQEVFSPVSVCSKLSVIVPLIHTGSSHSIFEHCSMYCWLQVCQQQWTLYMSV